MKKKIRIIACCTCKYSSFSSLWGSEIRSFKTQLVNPIDEKVVKIGFNFEETGAVASYGTSEQKVLNLQLIKSTHQVVSMENKSK